MVANDMRNPWDTAKKGDMLIYRDKPDDKHPRILMVMERKNNGRFSIKDFSDYGDQENFDPAEVNWDWYGASKVKRILAKYR